MKNLEEQLKAELSRANIDFVVSELRQDISLLKDLWHFVFKGSPPIQMRAAWAIEKLAFEFPEILDEKINAIVNFLPKSPNDGTRRILVKLLTIGHIPKKLQGKVYDICYNWFFYKQSSIAVKAYGLEVMYNIACENPELFSELLVVIEGIEENAPGALIAKQRNISKRIKAKLKMQ